MAFTAEDKLVGDVLNKTVFEIPRNQRRYVWTKDNWEELLEDIYFSNKSSNKTHFIGSVVFQDKGKKDGLDYRTIIDGQQRVTTITIILLVLMKLFHEKSMENEFEGTKDYVWMKNNRNQNISVISSDYHISLDKLIEATIELKQNKEESVKSFLARTIIDKNKDEIIGDAYQYIYNSISEKIKAEQDEEEALLNIRNAVIDMQIIRIVSSSEEDSYTIFEILNARGQELEAHELLKNYIMRYIDPDDYRDTAKAIWEAMENRLGKYLKVFIDHYAWHKYGTNNKESESAYSKIQRASRGKNVSELMHDLKLKSEYYCKIVFPDKERCSPFEYEIFSFLKSKRQQQYRPLILSLMHQKEIGNLEEKEYKKILEYIYNFFVCYSIIGEEKSNNLRDTIMKYAVLFENDFSCSKLGEFANALKAKIPSYLWFETSFQNLGWSNHSEMFRGQKNKQRVQITLEIIEKHLSGLSSVNEYTIEHILPDSLGEESAHIGNLIPLENTINKNCKNLQLENKIEKYENSGFFTARGIAKHYKNKEFLIMNRTKYLAKLVYDEILKF